MNGRKNSSQKTKDLQLRKMIRRLWPDSVFAVFVWERNGKGRVDVNYISNSELEESGCLLRDVAQRVDKMAAVAKGRGRIGNACIASAFLSFLLMGWLAFQPAVEKICPKKVRQLMQSGNSKVIARLR